jgi:hypothetical protein
MACCLGQLKNCRELDRRERLAATHLLADTQIANHWRVAVECSFQLPLPQQRGLPVDNRRTKLTFEPALHQIGIPMSSKSEVEMRACSHSIHLRRLRSPVEIPLRNRCCIFDCKSDACVYAKPWWPMRDCASQPLLRSKSHFAYMPCGRCALMCSPTNMPAQRLGMQPPTSLGAALVLRNYKPAPKHSMFATSCRPPESMSYSTRRCVGPGLRADQRHYPHRQDAKSRMRHSAQAARITQPFFSGVGLMIDR